MDLAQKGVFQMELSMKIRLLLLALYEHKYNGKLYELREIFDKSGIKVSQEEMEETAQLLTDNGLLKTLSIGDTFYGQITVDGVEYLEENNFFGGSSYQPKDKIKPLEHELLRHRLDEMQLRLLNSQLGVIIDAEELQLEIEELKAMQQVLGKRNWLQMLKGKLFELTKGHINNTEVEELIEIIEERRYPEDKTPDRITA